MSGKVPVAGLPSVSKGVFISGSTPNRTRRPMRLESKSALGAPVALNVIFPSAVPVMTPVQL